MSYCSRRIWLGVTMACAAVATSSVIQAQEYLPPVIDRSSGVGQPAPVAQPKTQAAKRGAASKSTMSLEQRVNKLEQLLNNEALVDMLMRLDSLQTENQNLQGEVESFGHTLEGINQRQRDLYLDIDRRLRQIELSTGQSGSAAPNTTSTSVGVAAVAAAATAPAASDPAAERDAYQKAFNLLKEGQYDQAITAFQGFLTSYPNGDYTANAQYWSGEANYVTRRFKMAEQEFLKVIDRHPDSQKVSDAMLKLGYTYYELGNWDAAHKTLDNVKTRYPNTTVGRLAENRLQKMRLEGR